MPGIVNSQTLELLIRVKDAASAALKKINKGLHEVRGDSGKLKQQFDALSGSTFTLRNAFLGLGASMAARSLLKSAFQFNQTIEQSRIGIAALVRSFNTFTTKQGEAASDTQTYAESVRIANQIQRQLQIEGLKTVATYEELLRALQEGIGPAFKAGFDPQQIVRFTSLMVQAAAAISLPMDQLGQELRAIMDGTIDRNARIAKVLGLTNEKVKELAKSGELYDYLVDKLKEFGAAGEETAKTFQGAMSNLQDAVQMALGSGLEGTFRNTSQLLLDLRDAIVKIDEEAGTFTFNAAITQALAQVDKAISALLTGNGKSMEENLERWVGLLGELAVAFIEVVGGILKVVDALGPMLPVLVKAAAYWLALKTAMLVVVGIPAKIIKEIGLLIGVIKTLGGYIMAAAAAGLHSLRMALIAIAGSGGRAAKALQLIYVALVPLRGAFLGVAAAAGFAIVEIYKAAKAANEWRKAAKEARQAEQELFEKTAETKRRLESFKEVVIPVSLKDKSEDELKELEGNLQKAKAYWNAEMRELEVKARETNWLGNPTEDAKKAQWALAGVRTKLDSITEGIKNVNAALGPDGIVLKGKGGPGDDEEDAKKRKGDQERLEKMLQDDLVRLSGNKWAVLKAQAKQHYDEMVELAHGNKDLLLQAEAVYVRQLQKIRDEQQKELATVSAQGQSTRTQAMLQTQLVQLQAYYERGEVELQQYFSRRREIVLKQYDDEISALERLAELETQDPAKRMEIETEIFQKRQEQTQELLRLEQERVQAEKDLAQQALEIEEILLSLRGRATITEASPLSATFAQELAEMDHVHQQEIERLRQLNATKTQLDEAYYQQRREKQQLLADQERRLDQARLESAQTVATAASSIFGSLYEATGQKVKAFFYMQRAAAAAEAIINAHLAASKAPAQAGIAGIPLGAMLLAMGYANAAAILAQTIAGYAKGGMVKGIKALAFGGKVPGYSPHAKADNVLIRATAGEFMQPVETVRYYGVQAMEAIRKRLIPRELLAQLSVPSFKMAAPRFAYAEGGPVGAAPTQGGDAAFGAPVASAPPTIVNILDPDEFARFVHSSRGTDTYINWMSSKAARVKRALGLKDNRS